jgi:hypothetical protein
MWNETAEEFIVEISQLDDAIVAFGGLKVSAFAIYLDYFDDSVTMVRFHQQLFSVEFFSLRLYFQINQGLPEERELRDWLAETTESQ